jgi:hypothetical protein
MTDALLLLINIIVVGHLFTLELILYNLYNISSKGFNVFDYGTRATNNGFTHELASGHPPTRNGYIISAIHRSTTIIGDHDDNRKELCVGDFSIMY